MGVEIEVQDDNVVKQVRARELQLENTDKLVELNDTINNVNLEQIESNTHDIKNMVLTNLETQPNIEDIANTMEKVAQGISDIKRSQTNINKKINELQDAINNIEGWLIW